MTTINRGLFTSLRGDWKIPRALYQALDAEFNFDYDPCPSKPKMNGLESEWGNFYFVNPRMEKKSPTGFKKDIKSI